MAEEQVTTKAELLEQMAQNWVALTAVLDRLTPTALTTIRDAQGWSVKDHLIHMLYWERSALFFLQGKPRHTGLDVEEALYLQAGEDAINAAIFQKHQDLSLAEAMAQFRAIHQQLLVALQPLTDAELQKRYRFYLPAEPGDGEGPPAINVVYGNSAHHYVEHLAWIKTLIGQAN